MKNPDDFRLLEIALTHLRWCSAGPGCGGCQASAQALISYHTRNRCPTCHGRLVLGFCVNADCFNLIHNPEEEELPN